MFAVEQQPSGYFDLPTHKRTLELSGAPVNTFAPQHGSPIWSNLNNYMGFTSDRTRRYRELDMCISIISFARTTVHSFDRTLLYIYHESLYLRCASHVESISVIPAP